MEWGEQGRWRGGSRHHVNHVKSGANQLAGGISRTPVHLSVSLDGRRCSSGVHAPFSNTASVSVALLAAVRQQPGGFGVGAWRFLPTGAECLRRPSSGGGGDDGDSCVS